MSLPREAKSEQDVYVRQTRWPGDEISGDISLEAESLRRYILKGQTVSRLSLFFCIN